MASVPRKSTKQYPLSHVHPNHSLMHHSDDRDYNCHGCKISGAGPRYRCHACNVDVHPYCSDSPQELSSFLHHHRLALLPIMNHRRCDVCRESIDGMFYRCNTCDFDVHPLCTQFPEHVCHVIDGHHKLTLRKLSSGRCSVCETDCSSLWVYGCDVCRVNIHPKCLLKPYGSLTKSRWVPHAHAQPWTAVHQPNGYYVNPNGYGGGHFSYGGAPAPWGFPNHHIGYPPAANYGGNPRPPAIWGSMFGSGVFALVQNLAAGAIAEFIFGSGGA
ncbi:unnamed protein product [Citrullus colocynthis]|uniref:Phorbol-ester/DAG-type domain-containing protein n=1 Tax=Citrullus colocynthis TaxID=252529 RepID=A0ABP0YHG5_9ROSI